MGILEKIKKPASESKVEASSKAEGRLSVTTHGILLRPVLSEKTTRHELGGQYTFAVSVSANKLEVKKAVKELYGVRPIRVNMVNVEGKDVRFGRTRGRRRDWKKAIVILPKGQTISIHEGV